MHKWRPRPLHPCQNETCGALHSRPGKYCTTCQKRKERHGTFIMTVHPKSVCQTPACRSSIKAFGRCSRCHQLWKKGINPDSYHRPYRRFCAIEWCSNYSRSQHCCEQHLRFLKKLSDKQKQELHLFAPAHCTATGCRADIYARGLCLKHLQQKSKDVILLREFWPTLPGHSTRLCIGKPGCKRNAILFGRCPDCLYDWQFSLDPKRNFLKNA